MTDEAINPLKEETDALARIAMTHDGRMLHRFLRRVLESCNDFPTEGALLVQNGRRTLARDLMLHMAQGIESSGGRTGSSDDDKPILSRGGGGVHVASTRDKRRVSLVAGDGFQPYDSAGNPVDPGSAA